MISSLIPRMFLFELLLLFELLVLLFLLAFDDFDVPGEDVEAVFVVADVAFVLLLLLFELPLPLLPELAAPDEPPDDCFSFLSLIIIIYTVAVNH